MSWNPTSWQVTRRTRAPHERPREYNDPSKQHELDHYYDRSVWSDRIKAALSLIVLVAVLALVAFIAFNVMFG